MSFSPFSSYIFWYFWCSIGSWNSVTYLCNIDKFKQITYVSISWSVMEKSWFVVRPRSPYCRKCMCFCTCAAVSIVSMWPTTLQKSILKYQSWLGFPEACLLLTLIGFSSINIYRPSLLWAQAPRWYDSSFRPQSARPGKLI